MRYCVRCIEIICEEGTISPEPARAWLHCSLARVASTLAATAPGGVGRCPTCRAWLRKKADGGFEISDEVKLCHVCNQPRQIVYEHRGRRICDACFLGHRQQLRYECERCRAVVRIPHPMYRYQPTATEFGNNTWFCRRGGVGGRGCDDFTNWRVCASDVHLVPPDDAPEGWGIRDEWLARVREQRRRELRGEPGTRGANRGAIDRGLARFLDGPWLLVAVLAVLWWLQGS